MPDLIAGDHLMQNQSATCEMTPSTADFPRGECDLSMQNHRLDVALNNLTHGVCFFDSSQRLVLANRRYAEMYGLSTDYTRTGATLKQIAEYRVSVDTFPKMACEEYIALISAAAASNQPSESVFELKNGRIVSLQLRPMPDGGWVATHEDITERRQAERQLSHMARHDALTGLANRFMLREHMIEQAAGEDRDNTVAMICLDLDRFKHINDAFGHQVGDALLCAAALRLRSCVREDDLVVRLGGDEFAVVQTGAAQPNDATALVKRIITVIKQPFQLGEHRVTIGTSAGIAIGLVCDGVTDMLLKNADIAMYRAKADGRGTFCFFEAHMDLQMRTRRALETDLRAALENNELELYYQPKLNTQTLVLTGLEALIRWRHPKRGLMSPSEFIPLAEEIGLIMPFGEWVLREACLHASGWPDHLTVAVNLSPVQFKTPDLVDTIRTALEVSGLSSARLELEITETELLQEKAATLETLHKLRTLGVRIALDDFGFGSSSISYLHSFPFDRIKIDQSFVQSLGCERHSLAIVQAITGLGHALGIAVTSEGVETDEQLAILRLEHCDDVQGFLFGAPVPAADVAALIERFAHHQQ